MHASTMSYHATRLRLHTRSRAGREHPQQAELFALDTTCSSSDKSSRLTLRDVGVRTSLDKCRNHQAIGVINLLTALPSRPAGCHSTQKHHIVVMAMRAYRN